MQNENQEKKVSIQSYNDYCTLAKTYLNSYNRFLSMLRNLKDDKVALEKRLQDCEDVSASVSKYGLSATIPTAGAANGSVVERTLEKREKIRMRLKAVSDDVDELEAIISKIDRALLFMPTIEREIVKLHYIERINWDKVGKTLGMSRPWAGEKGNEALKKMALMLFGSVASMPEYSRFCFVR